MYQFEWFTEGLFLGVNRFCTDGFLAVLDFCVFGFGLLIVLGIFTGLLRFWILVFWRFLTVFGLGVF